jgi:hypothetical protein
MAEETSGGVMKLIGAGLGIVLCVAGLAAQEIKTTTTEKTKFKVKDGRELKVSGCVQRFEDAGYLLTSDAGNLKYVLVTNENLAKYVGRRVEVKGRGTDGDRGKLKIEREIGTSGEIDGRKTGDTKTKETTEVTGNVGFPYLSVNSVKKISNICN